MLYIRADGNSQIGAGHLMRCLAIAQALKDKGQVIIFITADEESTKLITGKGFATLTLQTDWKDMESELPVLLPILKDNAIDRLLIDSYAVTDTYLKAVGEQAAILYLDDCGERAYPVDMLINYNVYASGLPYTDLYHKRVMPVPKLLLGCSYAPLRAEFQNAEASVRRVAKDVLLTTGGADSHNAAERILQAAVKAGSRYHGIQFHVVSGAYHVHADRLKALEKDNLNIHVYQNVKRMSALMKKCDVAVAACGSTLYELAALGIPTVCFYFAENQRRNAEGFGAGLAKNAGDFANDPEKTTELILKELDVYLASFEERRGACETMMKMLDGEGAARIAEELNLFGRKRG